ncbi:uracil-DNA glycosylase [Altibacter sp.]|uniref:uracil-DNA glycosylase n=1 Tax=Altibacter sp. TaxID=2024823 RepID=UPI000C8E0BAA|nr:uracil-DNA glycosylase [Altibacter sp.]MAP53836.1 uracil-DNA glycosylase [Altibacter sp.]|tara:strand:- start:453 stop:1118 length:666 start_codon:yes stop_codon:yes gene_type:complete
MDVKIEAGWKEALQDEFNKKYFRELTSFVRQEYKTHRCFPPGNQIFSAFMHTPFHKVKVVILGQDPYHGPGQANGLCFSVTEGTAKPPSLQNIFQELHTDVKRPIPQSGNLQPWADQGVLLLNATLTVRAHQAGSHQNKGWEQFTDAVIESLSEKRKGLVFLLWGGYAKRKGAKIDTSKHLVLSSGHPSPLSANRGYWFGNKHFSKTNNYLKENGQRPIDW